MDGYVWLLLGLGIGVVLVGALRWFWLQGRYGNLAQARTLFTGQREHLEARFFQLAAASGKPRGLRWKACDWESEVEFARDRRTGQLAALVAVTIQFEAIEGSDMEGLPAVGNLRNASAVFFYDRGRWHTTGKTIFNLNPGEAIRHFGKQYERVEKDAAV